MNNFEKVVKNMKTIESLELIKKDLEKALPILQEFVPSEEFYHKKDCPTRNVPGVDFDDSAECNCKGASKYLKNSEYRAWESVGHALISINKILKGKDV